MTVVGSREDVEDVDKSRGEGVRDFAQEEGGGATHTVQRSFTDRHTRTVATTNHLN